MTMTNQPAPQPNDDRSLVTRLDNWLDQRTGIDSILHETLDEPIPGGAKWAYVFGSGLIFLFVSQIITGIAWRCITCHQRTMRTRLFPTS